MAREGARKIVMRLGIRPLALLAPLLALATARAQGPRLIREDVHADRLRAMWLGECIANWTGLRTEGLRKEPPFFTDADWGTNPGKGILEFVIDQDPWLADDDTDVEYVYLHLLAQAGAPSLTPEQVRDGWLAHMDPDFIWVSNLRAWGLMGRGVTPPATGMGTANVQWLKIDAQLTTEFFGAFCPGLPEVALRLAELPIRTTSAGHASHAAQFYTVLYSLAPQVDPALPGRDRAIWLTKQARRWVPDTSKAADVIDFVLADFLDNPDANDWERTRDRVYERYQLNAGANGFLYRGWTESSVNLACGVIALLYGQGDFKRTIQIGTLSGWDSDNGTATMGGLLGLLLGYEALAAEFPGHPFSDRYDIDRTRQNLPDHLPDDPLAQDTFSMMAGRTLPLCRAAIAASGGPIDEVDGLWLLPPAWIGPTGDASSGNPLRHEFEASANNQVPLAGGTVTAQSSVASAPPAGYGTSIVGRLANGFEHDWSGRDTTSNTVRQFYSSQRPGTHTGEWQSLTVGYGQPVPVDFVRFIEGDHFLEPASDGGWFESVVVELEIDGIWMALPVAPSDPLDASKPFQIIDFWLNETVHATSVRISGPVGGAHGFVTCAELDVLTHRPPIFHADYDLDQNELVDLDDLYYIHQHAIDLDGDGDWDRDDRLFVEAAVRWRERQILEDQPR